MYLRGGTHALIEKLYETLLRNGVKFELGTVWERQAQENDDEITIVTAMQALEKDIAWKAYDSLLVQFENTDFPKSDWFIYYFQTPSGINYSLFNPLALPNSSQDLPNNTKVIYKPTELTLDQLRLDIAQHLAVNSIENIVERKRWDPIMPCSSVQDVREIQTSQGKDGIFYAGDYLHGLPSLETAVYSAKQTVQRIVDSSSSYR